MPGLELWGSTSLVDLGPQEEVYRELLGLLFGGSGLTLGEAVAEAELLAWTGGWADDDVLSSKDPLGFQRQAPGGVASEPGRPLSG